MRRTAKLAAVLLIVLGSGCAGIHASSVPHCTPTEELPNWREVDWQVVAAHRSGDFPDLIEQYDKLTAYCIAINAARGDR